MNLNRRVLSIALPIVSLVLSACTTPRHKDFPQVKQGMDKSAVLEIAGGPDRSMRWHGKDRWIYDFRIDDYTTDSQEVHFEDGRVVYIGKAIEPAVTAADQDDLNETANRIAEKLPSNETLVEVRKAPVSVPEGEKEIPKAVFERVE